jgi:hypothetical protein
MTHTATVSARAIAATVALVLLAGLFVVMTAALHSGPSVAQPQPGYGCVRVKQDISARKALHTNVCLPDIKLLPHD